MENQTPEGVAPKHPKLPELEAKLKDLENSLLTHDPKMPGHLKEIHKYLIQFEELSHLLSEEQIAVILNGQQRHVGIILAAETKKAKPGKGPSLKGISADEL